MPGQDLILGLPWLRKNNVSIEPDGPHLLFKDTGLTVWTKHTVSGKRIVTNLTTLTDSDPPTPIQVNADAFRWMTTPKRRKNGIQVSAASMADIEKALKPKTYTDPRTKLPPQYHKFIDVFDHKKAKQASSRRPTRSKRSS
ncbi:hypothetical protein ACJ73_07726 [Blastomyces percursus]|uniref:Uncharacterized protein n=1 Tax=Blastomyces percursus TaxID=1658174 RepID=A0A1J9PYG2_9EURO|nr:hypothetical protein ACJ73_07726 [Blastomyces percursus]